MAQFLRGEVLQSGAKKEERHQHGEWHVVQKDFMQKRGDTHQDKEGRIETWSGREGGLIHFIVAMNKGGVFQIMNS